MNDPIAPGMAVRTGAQGRTVLRVGAEIIAVAGRTELEIAQLDESGTQITLRRGRIGVRLSDLDPARSIEIDIPRGGVWLLTPGDYDIVAGDDKEAGRVFVLDGRARVVRKGGDAVVSAGSVALLRGDEAVQTTPAEATADDFTAWWRPAPRLAPADPEIGTAALVEGGGAATGDMPALRYVSAAMTGWDALDAHGDWETIDGYGAVWFPRSVGDGWAPYRAGRWRWVAPWGWTWIDDSPWGFAPSHYGRWDRFAAGEGDAQRWGWVPGRIVARPPYMPAAVAFLGTSGVGLSYPDAFNPGVAWFPLAPGEPYWPSYTDDLAEIWLLNAPSVDDAVTIGPGLGGAPPAEIVTAEYRNRRFASVVPRTVFVSGKPVMPALVELPVRRLDNAPLLAGSPQILPPTPRSAEPPASQVAATAERRSGARVTKTMKTLTRALKQRVAPAVSRATLPARGTKGRAARPRVIGAPPSRPASLRHADAVKR